MAVMPCARAVRGFIRIAERPAMVSVPWSIDSAPVTILISVDFPAPFSPTSAWTSPARRSKDTPRSACTPANDLAIDSARSRTLSDDAPVTPGVVSHIENVTIERRGRKGRKVKQDFFAAFAAFAFYRGT